MTRSRNKGYLNFVLHAHLPFVRHPEYERFLEENWLFEALSETYLPLLRVFEQLKADRIPFRLTLSISPTLASMLNDEFLQGRYVSHLKRLIELSEKELKRLKNDRQFKPLAKMYNELFSRNLHDFYEVYKKNILKGLRQLEKDGYLDIITTAATHSFLPLYQNYPAAIDAQIQTAVISHGRLFGKEPSGMWLPECGFFPGLERYLKSSNLNYFYSSAHGILFAEEKPKSGVYAPLDCGNGVLAFGRDNVMTNAVWSAEDGYPGDFAYREFYRDIGFDLPADYILEYIQPDGMRVNTGFKYYRITGKTEDKKAYIPEDAAEKAKEHAENFLYKIKNKIRKIAPLMDKPPYIAAPFDAELFGHWWFEGPIWIDQVLRMIAADEEKSIELVCPSDYLKKQKNHQKALPSFSSWGNKGYAEVWLDGTNDWIYRHTHKAIERMQELVIRFPNESGLKERVLNQAAREVMLAQASDWPFIMETGTTVPYAVRRVKEHLFNFTTIYDNLSRGNVNTEWLTKLEKKNNVFPDIDYRIFLRE
ncbi:MAG: DUF1957 domain-containing protein [Spirochaetales bacterium]|nr:DUF1957 domain-containing protein [Spirochaetales bacterium]